MCQLVSNQAACSHEKKKKEKKTGQQESVFACWCVNTKTQRQYSGLGKTNGSIMWYFSMHGELFTASG